MKPMQFSGGKALLKLLVWIVAFFALLNLTLLYLPPGFSEEPDLDHPQWYNYHDPKFGFYFSYREELRPLAPTYEAIAIFTSEEPADEEGERMRVSLMTLDRAQATTESDCHEHFLGADTQERLEPESITKRGRDFLVAGTPSLKVACHAFDDRWLVVVWEGTQPAFFTSSIASLTLNEPQRLVTDERESLLAEWKLAALTLEQQQSLYYHLPHQNLEALYQTPEITGHAGADEHIRALATARGYQLQFVPQESLSTEQDLIQPSAYPDWQALQAAAAEDGLTLGLTSTYRSVAEQRELFLSRLHMFLGGATYSEIPSGEHDAAIENTLNLVSPPGYSRHHSGYALDIEDLTPSERGKQFKDTLAFTWLSANDYANALRFGFIPSFPPGIEAGPEPEEWEYLWVGRDE